MLKQTPSRRCPLHTPVKLSDKLAAAAAAGGAGGCCCCCLSLLQGVGSLAVLPEVVQAVSGRAKVIVDGGFCRGTDIVKAIALGADGVALGRLTGLALAAGGEPALVRALDLLAEELWSAVGLLGCTSLRLLNSKHVVEVAHLGDPPHVLSLIHI